MKTKKIGVDNIRFNTKTVCIVILLFIVLCLLLDLLINGFIYSWELDVFLGFCVGIFYILVIKLILNINKKVIERIDKEHKIVMMEDEELIVYGVANYFYKRDMLVGKLGLTTTHLIYHSTKMNLRRKEIVNRIPLNTINKISFYKVLWILDYGLKVYTETEVYSFMLSDRTQWMEVIEEVKSNNLL